MCAAAGERPPVHVLVNPVAGGGRSTAIWRKIATDAAEAEPNLHVHTTDGPGHATVLAKDAVTAGCRRLVVVGGDGTIQEVVPSLLGTETAVGVVPAGTGNDFSRTHHIPRDPHGALQLALRAPQRRFDVGFVNGRPFVNVAGVGFDAEVAAWCKHRTRVLSGPAIYVAGIFRHLFSYSPQVINFTLDGEPFSERCLLLAVGNGRFYGGGMKMCPDAVPDDGVFDVCVGGNLGKLETLRLLPLVFSGRHVERPKVRTFHAKEVRVSSPASLSIHADGEPVGMLPAVFEILSGALLVAVPRSGQVAGAQAEHQDRQGQTRAAG